MPKTPRSKLTLCLAAIHIIVPYPRPVMEANSPADPLIAIPWQFPANLCIEVMELIKI